MKLFVIRSLRRCLAALPVLFALNAPAQSATLIVPRYGSVGDSIDVFGSGFNSTTVVRFGNGTSTPASRFVSSDTQITAVIVPANATTGFLTVQNAGGSANASSQSFTIIGPGPHITEFSPAYGAVGQQVIINGVHFGNSPVVRFAGVQAMASSQNNGTQITTFVPPGATNGLISVTTVVGTSNSPTAFKVIGPGPYIDNFNPAGATVGSPVVITGDLFNNPLSVRFGDSSPVIVNPPSFQQFTVNVPASATTGPISVSNALGGSISAAIFYLPPTPTNFVPATGRTGTNVVIRGISLNGVTAVSFDNQPASFTVSGSTQIVTTVPAGVSTARMLLQNPVHNVFTTNNFVVPPTLISFTPNFGPPPTSVTITGLNLLGSTVVKFGGTNATTVVATNQTRIFAHVPATAVTGPVSITTTNGSDTTLGNFYIPARILDFTPTNGPVGSLVTLTGQNFLGATAVHFGGIAANFDPPTNNTTLRAFVPQGVVTGPIQVTTPAGSTNSTKLFYGLPIVFGFSPSSGLAGTNVVITGTNFINLTTVSFNGVPATFTATNLSRVETTVPAGASTGPITVANSAGSFTTATNFVLEFLADLKLTITDSPDPVTLGSNLVYIVALTNTGPFAGTNVRLTNTLPAGVNLISATTTFPGSLTTGPVITANPGTLASGAGGTLTITVTPLQVGNLLNQTSARSDITDPVLADNNISVSTYVEPVARLNILRESPASVRIVWPVELTNHALQFSTNLTAAPIWSNITATPQIVGTQRVVIEPHTNATRFYRLRR